MTEYDAVFWDIGGVILNMQSVRQGYYTFISELTERYESDLTPDEAVETWQSALGEYFSKTEGTNYRPAKVGYQQAIDEILTVELSASEWQPLYHEIQNEHTKPNPGAIETIERLAESELHLGIISDIDHEEGENLLRNFGIRGYFDAFTSSEEVGRKKPDRAMFETALEKAPHVDAQLSAMIGDRYTHDMQGGHQMGMTTIGYGAEDGPAVDYLIEDLREVLDIVGITEV